jgi:PAS domain S-box-containing protein
MSAEVPDPPRPAPEPGRAQPIDHPTRDHLLDLVEQLEDYAIFLLSPEGRSATWAPGVERIFGYSEAEFIGQPAAQLFTSEDRARGEPERELLSTMEPVLRRWAVRVLEQQGYAYLEAGDGHEALRMAESNLGTLDLVLTDLVMPQMSGHELAEYLQRLRPGLPVLYMSGYSSEDLVRRELLQDGVPLLEKPFDAHTLVGRIGSILPDHRSMHER